MKLTYNLKSTTETFEIIIEEPDITLKFYAETLTIKSVKIVTLVRYMGRVKLSKAQNKKYRELIVKELTESK